MKIIVKQVLVKDTNLTDKKTGAVIQEQIAELSIPGKPVGLEIALRLDKNGNALPVGVYDVDMMDSFQQGRFRTVEFRPKPTSRTPNAVATHPLPTQKAA